MKKIINTEKAPKPVGAYNQAVVHNDTLFISGQIALDPRTGELVTDDLEAETRRVMENIKAILEEAGLTFDHVLKVSVFVSDMKEYDRVNAVYSEYFDEANAPARELIQVAALPKSVHLEISLIAAVYNL